MNSLKSENSPKLSVFCNFPSKMKILKILGIKPTQNFWRSGKLKKYLLKMRRISTSVLKAIESKIVVAKNMA